MVNVIEHVDGGAEEGGLIFVNAGRLYYTLGAINVIIQQDDINK